MSSISDYQKKLAELDADQAKASAEFKERREILRKEIAALNIHQTVYRVEYMPDDDRHSKFKCGLFSTREKAESVCRRSSRHDGVGWTGTVIQEERVLTLDDIASLDKEKYPYM